MPSSAPAPGTTLFNKEDYGWPPSHSTWSMPVSAMRKVSVGLGLQHDGSVFKRGFSSL